MLANRKIGFIGYVLRVLNALAALALLFAYFSQYISPNSLWFFAFFGLAYPIFLIINVFFVFWWIFRMRWFALLSISFILLGFSLPQYYVKLSNKVDVPDDVKSFKILTYNVHEFDYYTQTIGKGNEAFDRIVDYINTENIDIAGFQEFYSHDLKPSRNTWVNLRAKSKFKYGYRHKYNSRTDRMYLVIMSKFPIIDKGFIENAEGNKDITGIYVDVEVYGKIVRVYNVHLNTMGISSESHFVTRSYDLAKEDDMQVAATGVKRISTRIKRGFLNRALQSEQLKTHLENCPYPIILLGDFNDTPCSYAYTTLAEDLNDSFVTAGRGLSNSFNGIYPSYRIDYILFDKHFISFDYRRSKLDLSDHFPISSNFYFSEN